MRLSRYTLLPLLVSILVFIIPFFWLKPGEMDIGGDSSRLYFYDPLSYLFSSALYGVSASSFGLVTVYYFNIPFVSLLMVLKSIFSSSTLLISFFHGFSMSASFIFCYLIIKELIVGEEPLRKLGKSHFAAILGGLAYVLSPALIDGWEHVLLPHNQIFLNPLIFYLLLRYFKTSNINYILITLLLTFIFSPNFSIIGAPALTTFYPLSILFLILYSKFIIKRKIILKHLFFGIILFLGIQAFHLFPHINDIITPGSVINSTIFSNEGKFDRGLSFFSGIVPSIKLVINLLGFPQNRSLDFLSGIFIAFPALIVFSLFLKKKKTILLTAFFFIIVLFFATANITGIWLSFYKSLFNIPGFNMLRNFYGQWQFVYVFFYSILFGQALYVVLNKVSKVYSYSLLFFLTLILIVNSMSFLRGELVRRPLWQSNNVLEVMEMNSDYEKALSFIRSLPVDAKVLTFPLTDPGYQIVAGKNGGAYMGPSTFAYLAGKKDFAGFEEFGKYKTLIINLIRNQQFDELRRLFGFLNIKYIFYNADPNIYDKFPGFPYQQVRKFMPKDQKEYRQLVENLQYKQIKNINNKFFVFELQDNNYLPQIFIAKNSIIFNKSAEEMQTPISLNETDSRLAIFDSQGVPISNKSKFDELLIDIGNKSSLLDFLISTEKSEFGFPFASQKVTSPFYPYIVFREKQELASYKNVDKIHVDRRVFLAQKRIAELERWAKEFSILGSVKSIDDLGNSWKEPTIWEAMIFRKYNFWEISFLRYRKQIHDLIDVIEKSSDSNQSFIVNKAKVRRVISSDSDIFHRIIRYDEKLSGEQKTYLLKLAIGMFDSILNRLQFEMPSTEEITYNLAETPMGEYDLFIETRSIKNYNQSKLQVISNDKKSSFNDFQQENNWLINKNILIKKKAQDGLKLLIPELINLTSETKWRSVEEGSLATDSASLTINDENLTERVGLIREISDWSPISYYILSFDYLTYGKSFKLFVYDKGLLKQAGTSKVLGDDLRSREWKTYTSVLASGYGAASAFIQIMKPIDSDLLDAVELQKKFTRIDIKNLSVTQLPAPKIVLKKVIKSSNQSKTLPKKVIKSSNQSKTLPKITFTRINPTKYKIDVENAIAPYTLVFTEEFNARWRLVDLDPKTNTDSVRGYLSRFFASIGNAIGNVVRIGEIKESGTMSYFGGDVKENYSKNIFLDEDTFNAWGKNEIVPSRHFAVNGYSNAWYIKPDDLGGKTEYSLVLELEDQKLFYRTLLLSILTVILCVLFLTIRLFRRSSNDK